MKAMKTPGFTAETSLYQSSQHYQMTATSKSSLSRMTLLPQLFRLFPGAPNLFGRDDPFDFIVIGGGDGGSGSPQPAPQPGPRITGDRAFDEGICNNRRRACNWGNTAACKDVSERCGGIDGGVP